MDTGNVPGVIPQVLAGFVGGVPLYREWEHRLDATAIVPSIGHVLGEPAEEERRLIATLCRGARDCFEFGNFRGGTAVVLALNCAGTVYTLDLPWAIDTQIDDDKKYMLGPASGELITTFGVEQRVRQLYGNSATFDFSPYLGRMDLVFVDGAHDAETAHKDIENGFRMLTDRGVLLAHDYHESWHPGAFQAIRQSAELHTLRHFMGTLLVAGGPGLQRWEA